MFALLWVLLGRGCLQGFPVRFPVRKERDAGIIRTRISTYFQHTQKLTKRKKALFQRKDTMSKKSRVTCAHTAPKHLKMQAKNHGIHTPKQRVTRHGREMRRNIMRIQKKGSPETADGWPFSLFPPPPIVTSQGTHSTLLETGERESERGIPHRSCHTIRGGRISCFCNMSWLPADARTDLTVAEIARC